MPQSCTAALNVLLRKHKRFLELFNIQKGTSLVGPLVIHQFLDSILVVGSDGHLVGCCFVIVGQEDVHCPELQDQAQSFTALVHHRDH